MNAVTPPWPLGRGVCGSLGEATRREWLVTNGIGGYAAGTVAGELTRTYHGLLIAATAPPGRRMLLLAALDAELEVAGRTVPLATSRWASGAVEPDGYRRLERFELDGQAPVWTYAVGDVQLERRLWMRYGSNTTYVRFALRRGPSVVLRLKALVAHRDHHAPIRADHPPPAVEVDADGVVVRDPTGSPPLHLQTSAGEIVPASCALYRDVFLREEAARGYDAVDSHHHAATVTVELHPGEEVVVVAGTAPTAPLDGTAAWREEQDRHAALLERASSPRRPVHRRLVLAADQFLVRRPLPGGGEGASIMAGYPWFEDWGRDAMIALPGLCLATGRTEEASQILRTFVASMAHGLIPNRFPDRGTAPEYHTADATLWLFEAMWRTHQVTGDDDLVRELWPGLCAAVDAHRQGTVHGIGVDPADGLLRAGEDGLQLTWMDARLDDWVVTPRRGKPVELSALWISALRRMAALAPIVGADPTPFADGAAQAAASFGRFWNADAGCLLDVLDGPDGEDPAIRPNQVIAAALDDVPLTLDERRGVVERCADLLVTSHGLRTLAVGDSSYRGRYGGDQATRDAAYHQGTVWPWLLAPFVRAHLLVHGDRGAARSYLEPLLLHLDDAGLGSISEVFDGDPPHAPGGCPAQAWSVAALLEGFELLDDGTRTR